MSATVAPSPRRASPIVRPGTAIARASNQRILPLIRPGTQEKLPFSCECGMPYCDENVWLTLQEASETIARGAVIIGDHFLREAQAHSTAPGSRRSK